jgi:hypothetical protein
MILQAVISATTSITTIIILALSGSEQCSAPLDVFLSVCLILLLINLSISIHRYLYPQPLNDRMQRQGCVAEIKWYVDVLSAVWFVLGNYWLFASTECTRTAPMRFYMSLYYIIIGYAMIMLPVFMICSILLCMPFVWICLRTLQNVLGVQIEPRMQNAIINPFSRVRGLASAQINRIPAFEFGGDKHSATSDYANLTLTGEDAICSICLIEYTAGERLKSLPGCQHHFHADCVDQWLLINKTCPLCVRDVEIELSLKPTSRNEIECV